jgi:hypothetical protein
MTRLTNSTIVLALLALVSGQAKALEVITNGGFETGDLTAWTTAGVPVGSTVGACGVGANTRDWNVSDSGSATNCNNPGDPVFGSYAAYNMFNAGTTAPLSYDLRQVIVLPPGLVAATLSWADALSWAFGGSSPRVFSIDLFDPTFRTRIDNVYTNALTPPTDGSTGWITHARDISSLVSPFAGASVGLQLSASVPESWTGGAGMGVDEVSLEVTVPEPPVIALFGIGLAVIGCRRRNVIGAT